MKKQSCILSYNRYDRASKSVGKSFCFKDATGDLQTFYHTNHGVDNNQGRDNNHIVLHVCSLGVLHTIVGIVPKG